MTARARAKELRRDVDLGLDPLSARDEARGAPLVPELIDRFLREHARNVSPKYARDMEVTLKVRLEPRWRHRKVADIQPSDVANFLAMVAAGEGREGLGRSPHIPGTATPTRANRIGSVLRKMFSLAVAWKMRADNPAAGFHRRVEVERERFLSFEEIERLSDVLNRQNDHRSASYIRLCMLTGARSGEVRRAEFSHFDLALRVWTKPATYTKQRRVHRVPISDAVADIVRQRRVAVPQGCRWLFPGEARNADGTWKDQPISKVSGFWYEVRDEAGLEDVRLHDLRHTFASLLVSGGSSLEMIGKLLGHSQSRTTMRYAHLLDAPLRAGVDSVAEIVRSRPRLVGGSDR